MSIYSEILDWRLKELIAGREPKCIPLSSEQINRLKEWCDSTPSICVAPDNSLRYVPGLDFSKGMMIAGMMVKPILA